MKKILNAMALTVIAGSAVADEGFYYFKQWRDDTYHYTRILRCSSTDSVSDTRFVASDAVGPFNDYAGAKAHRELAVISAKKAGATAKLSQGVCAHQ